MFELNKKIDHYRFTVCSAVFHATNENEKVQYCNSIFIRICTRIHSNQCSSTAIPPKVFIGLLRDLYDYMIHRFNEDDGGGGDNNNNEILYYHIKPKAPVPTHSRFTHANSFRFDSFSKRFGSSQSSKYQIIILIPCSVFLN